MTSDRPQLSADEPDREGESDTQTRPEPRPPTAGIDTDSCDRREKAWSPGRLPGLQPSAQSGHFPSRPSSLTLAARSSPAFSVFTFLSISLMMPSLSM